jgi:sulfane dehydrogenase subunit SoxC
MSYIRIRNRRVPRFAANTKNVLGRRGFLAGGGMFAAGLLSTPSPASDDNLPPHIPAWMKEQGEGVLSPTYGRPSPFEKNVVRRRRGMTPTQTAASSNTPLADLHGIITPNGLHL